MDFFKAMQAESVANLFLLFFIARQNSKP